MSFGGGVTLDLQEDDSMLLKDKVAVIYGGSGALGRAMARAFAREGARVCITGLRAEKLRSVAGEILAEGGCIQTATLDALDEVAVEHHARTVAAEHGRIDIAVNAVGIMHVQGKPLFELSLAEFESPIHDFMRAEFLTARAAARHMTQGGVVLMLSTPGAKLAFEGALGFGVTCGAIETFTRLLARELASRTVRVVCLRADAIPEALELGSYARDVFRLAAERAGTTVEQMLAPGTSAAISRQYPRLAEVAAAAVFAASEQGASLNGTVMNLTGGVVLE